MARPFNPFTSPIIPKSWHGRIWTVGECCLWNGWNNSKTNAHGKVRVNGKVWYLRRYVYSRYYRIALRSSQTLAATCANQSCFNPQHMAKK